MQTQSPLESLRSAALAFEHYNSATTLALQHYNGALTLALQCYNSTKTATVFYLNGSTLVSFLYFQQQFWGKIVDFSGIRTWLIWAEGERADHLTSTTTVAANCWRWCNIRSNYHYSQQTARNNGKILLIYCAVSKRIKGSTICLWCLFTDALCNQIIWSILERKNYKVFLDQFDSATFMSFTFPKLLQLWYSTFAKIESHETRLLN